MTFLPIVQRELRAAARRKSTFRIRSWTAILAMFVGLCSLPIVMFTAMVRSGSLGNPLFNVLSYYAFGVCLLAGVFLTADCLSEEKREGTMGLLFLTDLKGYDVVLGKFMATSLNAFYGLLAVLPVLGIPVLLGGVTEGEFWRMALALLNGLFFSLAAGMWVSALARDSQPAMGRTLALLVFFVWGLPALAWLGGRTGLAPAWSYLAWVSPYYPFSHSAAMTYVLHQQKFWTTLVASQAMGWAFLGLASAALPRRWQETTLEAQTGGWVGRRPSRSRGSPAKRARTREKLLPINPVAWLMSSEMNFPWAAWVIVAVWGLIVGSVTLFTPRGAASLVTTWYVVRPFGFLLKVLFALQVCRFFAEARRNGALEMLLCTPLQSRDLLRAQSLALMRTFLWPVVAFVTFLFVPLAVQVITLIVTSDFDQVMATISGSFFTLACAVGTVADFCAVYWFGLWLALSMKKPNLAPGLTILFVLVLPTPLSFCFLDIFVDLFFILWGATKLQQDLRWLISQQYQAQFARQERIAVRPPPGTPPIIRR